MVALTAIFAAAPSAATITVAMTKKRSSGAVCYAELSFPSFLPKQVENIKDTFAQLTIKHQRSTNADDTFWFWYVGRLHCLYPWWEDATVDFMISRGYNVSAQIQQVKQKTLIIWGEDDQIISNKLAVHRMQQISNGKNAQDSVGITDLPN
ncbi:hypothetical protein CFP56_021939 [Quercus suber]|uniref:Uncharacterized protein n=1 Tax=Quercus suber TaxID=58331 RepID=A0AAW0KE44_QUESU